MDIFLTLVTNLIPLYMLIAAGFVVGRYLHIDKQTLANILFYLAMPIVFFGFVAGLDLKPEYALLPVIAFTIHVIVGLGMWWVGRKAYPDKRANLLSMCGSMGNTGYFGLPLVLLLFKPEWVGVYMFMILGFTIYEATFGLYIAARGNYTVRDSLKKLLTFPSIYALCAGLLVNHMQWQLPDLFTTYWTYFKGCYVVLGMMIVGVALSKLDRLVISARFLGLSFFGKFVVWPLLAYGFILLDTAVFGLFGKDVHSLIFVVSLVPPAANVTAFAAQFDVAPEKAATTVLLGTIFALFYIPAMLALFGM